MSPALDITLTSTAEVWNPKLEARNSAAAPYYNARLDPSNYMDGPLSTNPATRLRQLLARPGIIVGVLHF
jgi:hypothetical protein